MQKKIVTLIGRTNVGKSTLFNKLIGKRKAITEDIPGVTRDRVYDKVEWQGKEFILSDTGGLDISNKEMMNNEIKNQVSKSLTEASLILFVVDAKEGLNPQDEEIANVIRKYKKPVIIVANKVDNNQISPDIYDFYQMGFDSLMIISAEQSKGLGDLLDKIVEKLNLDLDEEKPDDDQTRIAIIGKPNAGKSSLVNLLLKDERMIVTDIAGTTRDSVDSYWKYNDKDYILVDTAGLRKKNKIKDSLEYYSVQRTLDAVDSSDVCLFLIDATVGVSEQDTKIAGYAHNNKKAIIIAVNKRDLVEKNTNTMMEMEKKIRNTLAFIPYAPIVFMSVKTSRGISSLLETIEIVDNNYSQRIKTGVLNDIITDAILQNSPPTDKGKRLKIFYMTQVSVRPPIFNLYVNTKELMHFSYLRYIENQIRENYKFVGVPFTINVKSRSEK
ncbi:MAG: ribosome biogenesis GTPase Der [Peptoniphilaceae bacterium]|nr:ribosome biogenesis GTPase Der [Peptoniphilaceae bacterium]MDD7383461.1 ribosome biogenesis GTPase Der [Peptoniphilaceae bacterium]MDY3738477.1 ribosome biogenesis GTPase Der [Peptoniphilaceae bacterium]